jgi:integrase
MIEVRTSKLKGNRYKVHLRDLNGKMMRSHTWSKKIDAEREERELYTMRDQGAANPFVPIPLAKATDMWLKDAESRCGLGQMKKLRLAVNNYYIPFFGCNADIKKLKPSNIAEFVVWLDKTDLAVITINNMVKTLGAMFNFHLEDDNVLTNPVKKKHRSKKVEIDKEQVVWTEDEASRFLEHADKKYRGDKRWVLLFYKIALNTGMRYGEVVALEKSDFDFEGGRVRVSKSMDRHLHQIKTPKNGKTRYAPLSSKLAEEVMSYLVDQQIFKALFLDKNNEYYSYSTFRQCHYLKDVQEAGVRQARFHGTRRFYVTHFMENGGNETQLRKIVGHAGQQMTDLYTARPNDLRKAAEVINL